jgi:quinol monooxygenase YgiN
MTESPVSGVALLRRLRFALPDLAGQEVQMYGTIAKMKVKPGKFEAMQEWERNARQEIPGMIFSYTYRSDSDPNEVWIVVGFESREAYRKNAESPEMNEMYKQYRALLDADPEWHDGEIISSEP